MTTLIIVGPPRDSSQDVAKYHCRDSIRCIKINQRCDGKIDCPCGDDEENCSSTQPATSSASAFRRSTYKPISTKVTPLSSRKSSIISLISDPGATLSSHGSGSPSFALHLGLGLGLGIGLALLFVIFIIIILCCTRRSRDRTVKRSEPNVYSKFPPNIKTASAKNGNENPNYSAEYYTESESPNSTINRSTFNRHTIYAPSAPYKTFSSSGSTASVSSSSSGSTAPQQSKVPSVLCAIVNKIKPKKNPSNGELANPSDDLVIVENQVYGVQHI